LYFKVDEGKLKDNLKTLKRKRCKYFVLTYSIFKYFNIKIVRKGPETHLVAHYLKYGWGKRNYIDL